MTERCVYCGLFAGQEYKSDYYKLNDSVFCSLPCFNESLRDAKLNNKPKVQPRITNGKSGSKNKRITKKVSRRKKSAKHRK